MAKKSAATQVAYGSNNRYELTPEHRGRFDEWRDRWIGIALRTKPQTEEDRARCVEAVNGMYRAAKLKEPRVIFVPSPIVGALSWCFAAMWIWLREHPEKHREFFGRQVSEREIAAAVGIASNVAARAAHGLPVEIATRDATGAATRDATRDATGAATRDATRDATGAATRAATGAATGAATWDATWDATGDATWDATRAATWDATGAATEAATWDATEAATGAADLNPIVRLLLNSLAHWNRGQDGGNHWAGYIAYLSFFRVVADLRLPQYEHFIHYEQAAIHGSHRFMHRDFCMVSDFPLVVGRDAENRSHAERGPALQWSDGWSVYSWRGQRVPREWIEARETIDPSLALTWPQIEQRRALAEILGWDKVLGKLSPRVIDTDSDPQIGQLLEVDLPDSPRERFLRVECGTGRRFVLPVPPEMRTALEANAWTYGLRPEQYRPEVRT